MRELERATRGMPTAYERIKEESMRLKRNIANKITSFQSSGIDYDLYRECVGLNPKNRYSPLYRATQKEIEEVRRNIASGKLTLKNHPRVAGEDAQQFVVILHRHMRLSQFIINELFTGIKPEKAIKVRKLLESVYSLSTENQGVVPPFGAKQSYQYEKQLQKKLKKLGNPPLEAQDVQVLEVVTQRLKKLCELNNQEESKSDELMVSKDYFHLVKHTLAGMRVLSRDMLAHKIRNAAQEQRIEKDYLKTIDKANSVLDG